jgi:hypothetical protein
MPLNPPTPVTKRDKAQKTLRHTEFWLGSHAALVAAFLGGVIVGAVFG